jgi:hypothetical protein
MNSKAMACIAVSYLDRFMSTNSPRVTDALQSRLQYQLVRVNFDFVVDTICQSLYQKDEINACEIEILQALQWKLNSPSPHDFIDALVGLLLNDECTIGSTSLLSTWAKKYADAAVLDYEMSQNSSLTLTLAYTSLLTALQLKEILFHPKDMIDWITKLESTEGTRIDEKFILELENIIHNTNELLSSPAFDNETETIVVSNTNKRRISTAA